MTPIIQDTFCQNKEWTNFEVFNAVVDIVTYGQKDVVTLRSSIAV